MADVENWLFVGLSFIILAIVQLLLLVYQTAVFPLNPSIPILFFVAFFIVAIIFILVLETIDKKQKKLYHITSAFIIISLFLVLIAVFGAQPKAHIGYTFTCPNMLFDDNDNTDEITLSITNIGQVYGNILLEVSSSEKNITFDYKRSFLMTPFKFSPDSFQYKINLNHSAFVGDNFTINMSLNCINVAVCDTLSTFVNQKSCTYSKHAYISNVRYDLVNYGT